jgi:hypothetical protein
MTKLVPLYDQKGIPQLWLGPEEWLYDEHGQPAAFILGDSIFSIRGLHIAWWDSASVLGGDGSVMLVTRAGNPLAGDAPYQLGRASPAPKLGPAKPAVGRIPARFHMKRGWSRPDTLMDQVKLEQSLKHRGMKAGQ